MSAAQDIGYATQRLMLVDISGIYRAYWHSSGDDDVNAAASKTLEKFAALRSRFPLIVACCDSPPYSRRLALLPTYKGNRDKPSETMVEQFRRVRARLEQSGVPMWRAANEEADDVIASAVARAKIAGVAVTIASSDKDLLQLVDDDADVEVYSPLKDKTYRREDVIAEWGVPPDMLLDSLALQGDKSDNVPSLPGVGPKTAASLLLEHGSFDAIFANADKIAKPKLQEAVANFGDAARLARKVIALRTDLPIPWETAFQKGPTVQTPEAEFDPISPPPNGAKPVSSKPAQPAVSGTLETPTIEENKTTALAIAPPDWSLALEPTDLGKAQKLAVAMYNSQMYTRFPNADAIFAVMIRGRELGLGALASLDAMHFFEGKPAMHAHLIVDRAKKDPDCEYFRFIDGDDTFAEYETKNRRNPEPTRLRYTIEQAKQAGICPEQIRARPPAGDKDRRGQWEKRPAEQLRKTCAVQLTRIEYPGAALGLYSVAELGGDE